MYLHLPLFLKNPAVKKRCGTLHRSAEPQHLPSRTLYPAENRRLREKLAEARKENLFPQKAAAFFTKGIDERHIDP